MSEQETLLRLLEAHGKAFLQSFSLPGPGSATKRKPNNKQDIPLAKRPKVLKVEEQGEEEEWHGISDRGGGSGSLEEERSGSSDDDGFTAGTSTIKDDKVLFFSEENFRTQKADFVSKSQMKAFMSSKVSKLRDSGSDESRIKEQKTTEEREDEMTNAKNDALLHKLVHTRLLSGSLNPDLDMTPAHRRKALAGRVMELAGESQLGQGEKAVRNTEKRKAGKRVREGLARKQKEREKHQLEEAKNLGNYHPTLKQLFAPSSTASSSRSRTRGLGPGVGKFRGGVLQLSRQEINSVTGGLRHKGRKQGRKEK